MSVVKGGLAVLQAGKNVLTKVSPKVGKRVSDATAPATKAATKVKGQVVKATAVGAGVIAAGTAGVAIYNDIKNGLESIQSGGGVGNAVTKIVPAIGAITSSMGKGLGVLTYPKTLGNTTLNPAYIKFQFYDRDTNTQTTTINLPMPNTVNNPNSISWDQQDFGMLGDAVVRGIKAVGSGTGSAEKIKAHLDSMAERMKSVAFYSGMSEIVQKGGGNNLSADDMLGASTGKALNPYKTMLFRGVNFRTFTFSFDLVPFEESDCDLINNIITAFRAHSYPDFSGDKMFFTFPDECQITYMWESGTNKWLNNFKRAVCTNVEIDYAPMSHWSSIRNGFPNVIRINTQWSEVEIISRGDILNNNNQGQSS